MTKQTVEQFLALGGTVTKIEPNPEQFELEQAASSMKGSRARAKRKFTHNSLTRGIK